MISIHIDDIEVFAKPSVSVLEACKYIGINIPRFCYHETLSVAGNCRMCLVEMEEVEKPVASCVTEISEGMSIYTDSAFVKKSRENVVEALLLNHPLDCPICDQAGECDLQDQVKKYGSTSTRYFFKKRGVEDKYCGPLIKTIMTRCISCTRCVRFSTEIAGQDFFGTLNRGGSTEIGSYVPNFFDSEISSNVVDLCPVGALTSLPYAFKARPWELRLVESIDTTDSLGSNIYINYKETEIFRILPKQNKEINENLISDRARYNFDANNANRILLVYAYNENTKRYSKIGWKRFLKKFDLNFKDKNEKFFFICNNNIDYHTILLLKSISNRFPNQIYIKTLDYSSNTSENFFAESQKNLDFAIQKTNGLILFIGTNPKLENSILNAKVRGHLKNNFIDSYSVGLSFKYNWKTTFINLSVSKIINIINGKFDKINFNLFNKQSLLLIGNNFSNRVNNLNVFIRSLNLALSSSVDIFFLYKRANSSSIKLNNIKSFSSNLLHKINKSMFINADDTIYTRKIHQMFNKIEVMWYNTHGSYLALKSNYILPASSSYEKESVFLNLEYRPQKTQKVLTLNNSVKNSFDLIQACFQENLNNNALNNLEFSYINEQIINKNSFVKLNEINNNFFEKTILKRIQKNNHKTLISKYPIFQENKNFYQIDTYTRNSFTLSQCKKELLRGYNNFE